MNGIIVAAEQDCEGDVARFVIVHDSRLNWRLS